MGSAIEIAVIAAVGLLIFVAVRSVVPVPQGMIYVVERFGRYRRSLDAGLNFIIPIVDKIRQRVDVRERLIRCERLDVFTSDRQLTLVDWGIYFSVSDVRGHVYGMANFDEALEYLCASCLRGIFGEVALKDAMMSRDEINEKVRHVLDQVTGAWGVRVHRVELRTIMPAREMAPTKRAKRGTIGSPTGFSGVSEIFDEKWLGASVSHAEPADDDDP